jgi:hypothetical protein
LQGVRRWVDRFGVRSPCPTLRFFRGAAGTRRVLLSTWLMATVMTATAEAWADPAGDLEKAHTAYVAHKYDEAETRLRALLDAKTMPLTDPNNLADARMYLGAVLVAEAKKDEAAHVFEQLLFDKPDYEPDPLRVSMDAVDVFFDARSRSRDKLAAIQAERVRKAQDEKAKVEAERQKAVLRLATLEKLASEEVVTEKNSRWKALLPFGVGQFQNREDALGVLFLSTEVALAIGSIVGAGLTLYDEGQARQAYANNDQTAPAYNQHAQVAALVGDAFAGGFALVAAIGILQAQLAFVPEHVEVRTRTLPPLSRFTLRPVLGLGAAGLAGTF